MIKKFRARQSGEGLTSLLFTLIFIGCVEKKKKPQHKNLTNVKLYVNVCIVAEGTLLL